MLLIFAIMPFTPSFSSRLAIWYAENARELPWRKTKDPYRIWLSEVIMQQTRVAQGTSYYLSFVERYPTVAELAVAPLDDVLKLWQGLGYYSRARNLHQAAITVQQELGGKFPNTAKELKKLSGVGDYTAAAIASICYDEPVAVVDGNVLRVLSRLFGIETAIDTSAGRRIFNDLANKFIDEKVPGDHNQAVMEFGALQCTPRQPACSTCTFHDVCVAIATGMVGDLPKKGSKTSQKDRFFNYLIIQQNNKTLMQQRVGKGIWQGLYQFPLIETQGRATTDVLFKELQKKCKSEGKLEAVAEMPRHILSHQRIHARFWRWHRSHEPESFPHSKWVDTDNIDKLAVPRLIEKFLLKHGLRGTVPNR